MAQMGDVEARLGQMSPSPRSSVTPAAPVGAAGASSLQADVLSRQLPEA